MHTVAALPSYKKATNPVSHKEVMHTVAALPSYKKATNPTSMEDTYTDDSYYMNYVNSSILYLGYKDGSSITKKVYYSIHYLPSAIDLPLIAASFSVTVSSTDEYTDNPLPYLSLYTVPYIADLSGLCGNSTFYSATPVTETQIVTGQTTYSFDILNIDFLLSVLPEGHVTYCLDFDNQMRGYLTINSIETGYRPSLILTFGYNAPNEILSDSVSLHNRPFTLTNNYDTTHADCTMLLPGSGTYLSVSPYVSNNSASKLCFVLSNSNTQTVKICFYGSGKYLCTISSSAGSPVDGDPYGSWDSWQVIRLNNGALIIRSASNSNMVLTRRPRQGQTNESVCVDYLSEEEVENQLWRIVTDPGDGRTIDTGATYLNSYSSKEFLIDHTTGTTSYLEIASATEADDYEQMTWSISYLGNGKYTIRNASDTDKWLYVNSSGAGLTDYTGTPTSKSIFTISEYNNHYSIKSDAGYYLKCTNSGVLWSDYSLNGNSESEATWRVCLKSDYNEFNPHVPDYQLLIDDTKEFQIVNYTSNEFSLTDASDFDSFTVYQGNSITLNHVSGNTYSVHSNCVDVVNIATVRHKPTNQTVSLGRVWSGNAMMRIGKASKKVSASSESSILLKMQSSSYAYGFGEQLWYTEYAGKVNGVNLDWYGIV